MTFFLEKDFIVRSIFFKKNKMVKSELFSLLSEDNVTNIAHIFDIYICYFKISYYFLLDINFKIQLEI